ncbi:MAG: DUF4954 family protein [Sediminispirochaetaceae bacterium]
MDNVKLHPEGRVGKGFVPAEYLREGEDEYAVRNRQNPAEARKDGGWRELRADEREILVLNGNTAEDWDEVLVSGVFDPKRVQNCSFHGLVRIGTVRAAVLEHHDLQLPVGLRNCFISECDIGDDCALYNVHYLAHYIIGDRCIIANVDEMHTTNHAKFGNGIVKDGEPEEVRVWLDVMNETGSRMVMPFDGMITADAYLWGKYRDDEALQKRLGEMTQERFDSARGYYGTIGDQTVIKTSRILKDVKVGDHCYIKGANKLKNLTINSSEDEPSQIGEGVELVNGIIGYGCHIFYGCKAVRFILGNNSSLKYGARLINSFLGDNSTISCCEVLNNLIFPAHEQHHNNSFLIASVVKGQSNLAAGATIGSNHNSRANDNEVEAGRGFWPGLCTSLKHSSRFASFVLLAKGAYPAELDIRLPFSLLNNNESAGALEVIPAFWWLYNMYALARNSWKFQHRDKRKTRVQHIEFDYLAPDTAEEILEARKLLSLWTGRAALRRAAGNRAGGSPEGSISPDEAPEELISRGRALLESPDTFPRDLKVYGEGMEKSRRPVLIVKPAAAYRAYGEMLVYYGVKNVMAFMNAHPGLAFHELDGRIRAGGGESTGKQNSGRGKNAGENEGGSAENEGRAKVWVNMGGQLMKAEDADTLRADIGAGRLRTWDEVHARYDELWSDYPLEKQRHAYEVLCELTGAGQLQQKHWLDLLYRTRKIQEYIRDQVYNSRNKDFENTFRKATYRNIQEMTAAIGTIGDNSFIRQVREETDRFLEMVDEKIKMVL